MKTKSINHWEVRGKRRRKQINTCVHLIEKFGLKNVKIPNGYEL